MKEYGTVISTFEGPSTRRFSFVINKGNIVRRGQFVQLDVEDGKLIGRVSDVMKSNKYFMRPESVKEYQNSGKRLDDIFPVDGWECLVADVIPLGVFSNDSFRESSFPASPGTKVFEPDLDILGRFFGLDPMGLNIGKFSYHDLDTRLNVTRLFHKHLAILAMSGAGKSYLVSVLFEELLKRGQENGLAVIVIDPHGEYISFADDPDFSAKTRVFPCSDIRIGLSNLSHHQINEFLHLKSYAQLRVLTKVIRNLKVNKNYGINDVIKAIEEDEKIKPGPKDVLTSMLYDLAETGIFGLADYPPINELARQGGLSVVDLSATTDMRKKHMITAYIARKLFNMRRRGLIPPFLLVLEEAHQFVPEGAKREDAIARTVLTTIAREGRKFHASLCLISQRPVRLSTTILSQCNTHIILRITNPYDLDRVKESSEGITRDVANKISSLQVGKGLIVGEAVNFPLFIDVRKRSSKESEKGLPLERAAREYYKKKKQQSEDAKNFM